MFGSTPEKYESRALEAERKGKDKKVLKYREKAAQLRAKQAGSTTGGVVGTSTTIVSTTTRTPADYETRALKWEQRGNYTKAQKNRGKVWRIQNPQYATVPEVPVFYTNNQFLGYNQAPPTVSMGTHARGRHNPAKYEARAAAYESRGRTKKALKNREKAAGDTSSRAKRTPETYDAKAIKWEGKGNFTKAQKNREKAWRLRTPDYAYHAAPTLYLSDKFVGYQVAPGTHARGRHNPAKYEARALAYESRGRTNKALKYREKAKRIAAGQSSVGPTRTSADYEAKAVKWEGKGNFLKAQKNREKAWRLINPTTPETTVAPNFYKTNTFTGYNY